MYKYTCEHCSQCYIGETRRHIHTRIKEHLAGRPPSEISMHVHPPDSSHFSILMHTVYTRIAETLLIRQHLRDKEILMNNNKQSEHLLLF